MLVLLGVVASTSTSTSSCRKAFSRSRTPAGSIGCMQADQSISFQAMSGSWQQMIAIVQADPAVDSVVGFTGGGGGSDQFRKAPCSSR